MQAPRRSRALSQPKHPTSPPFARRARSDAGQRLLGALGGTSSLWPSLLGRYKGVGRPERLNAPVGSDLATQRPLPGPGTRQHDGASDRQGGGVDLGRGGRLATAAGAVGQRQGAHARAPPHTRCALPLPFPRPRSRCLTPLAPTAARPPPHRASARASASSWRPQRAISRPRQRLAAAAAPRPRAATAPCPWRSTAWRPPAPRGARGPSRCRM